MTKPFWKSLPISINDLPSRKAVLRDLVHRVKYGEGVCLSGDLRIAKTSLLKYLISNQDIKKFFASSGQEIFFSYVNCQTIPNKIEGDDFWHLLLQPLFPKLDINDSDAQNPKKVMRILNEYKEIQYVIILDEFDVLLSHPVLGKEAYILGQFRDFSNSIDNFSIIISSPYSLADLSRIVREREISGSPLFNYITQIHLGTLSEDDILTALKYAVPPFSPKECQFIVDISGGHPFLIETAASALWEQRSETNKYNFAIESIHRNAEPFFADKWHRWSEHQRETIVAITLLQTPLVLSNQSFNKNNLVKHLELLRPEIFSFRHNGEIIEDSKIPGGYRIRQEAMLWWIADEIFRTIREGGNFEEWLLEKKKSSTNAKNILSKVVDVSGRLFEKGASSFMEAYIKQLMNP
ncbi:MAG: hypothetical protein CVU39_18725 [Chloroflexi bacterium HGW-Chloroflexi-10]|nr:MAG: hypothetical protein CVU39_18725 [Chloroflexi bacterium HGW-Chloroflexi-10]